MKKVVILILVPLMVLFSVVNAAYVRGDIPIYMLEGGPEWENYILDEEANKDKLFCRTSEDEQGNIIETRWYNTFTNPNEVVRVDEGDTTSPNCDYPNHEPVYARGSNEGKVYSRVIMDEEGKTVETLWYDACTNEIIRSDEGDTTSPGSDTFSEKCYHPDYIIEEEEKLEEIVEEGEIEKTIAESYFYKIINWFKSLFKDRT